MASGLAPSPSALGGSTRQFQQPVDVDVALDHSGEMRHRLRGHRTRIKRGKPADHGCGARRHAGCVHDQHHRKSQQARRVGRAAGTGSGGAVERTHHAFDDADIGTGRMPQECLSSDLVGHHPRVNVPRFALAHPCVVTGIDEIRTALERLNDQARRSQRRHQAECHRRLASAARRSRNDEGTARPGRLGVTVVDGHRPRR
jgi:hypothetical protein